MVRGGLTLMLGVLAGNLLGFVRVAVIANLLGTHSLADSLAVAIGPLDTLNSVLINSVVFAFVPMLTALSGGARTALFLKLNRSLIGVFTAISVAVIVSAPWLLRILAPGLDPQYLSTAALNLRILALSTVAAGAGAVHCALLYTERRFLPAAFYQAALNVCTIAGALVLWKFVGVYAFAIGYAVGAWVQVAIVFFAARSRMTPAAGAAAEIHWRDILSKPGFFVVYAAGLGLNITFTRAWATHAGPGMAAALDYCMRGVNVPLALMVTPISNSLLPEIARLRSLSRMREALRLIDRTLALTALVAIAGCAFALIFREQAIALLFQRGKFTADSTRMVSAIFLGMGPSLVGWSLIEIMARSLFALNRPRPAVLAAWLPVLCNAALTLRVGSVEPQWIGPGASVGLIAGFWTLFTLTHVRRKRWLDAS